MGVRSILLPWDSQPQDPTPVDWQSPFALGLVDGYSTGGGVANRLINGARPTAANFSIAPRYNGLLLKGSGTASGLQLPAVPIAGANRLQVTSLVHITSQSGEMIFEQSAVADSNAGFYFYGLSSSVFRILVHNGTSASFYDATYTMPARPVVLTVRVDISANPFTTEVWVDGALAASGSGALAAGTFLANTLNVGCRNGSTLPSDGAFGDLFVHNKWMPNSLLADWHRTLWEIYEARRIPIPVAAGGGGAQTVAIGQASETDLAQALSSKQTLVVGQAAETDTAQALTTAQAATVGQAAETDTAGALTYSAPGAIAQASETDEAQALAGGHALAIGQAAEADSAGTLTYVSGTAIGMALEIDTAGAFAAALQQAIGQASETDLAQALTVGSSGSGTGATAAEIVAAIMAHEVETGVTVQTALRVLLAAVSGPTSGLGTSTERYFDPAGLIARITANFDGNSNRTSVTLDGS